MAQTALDIKPQIETTHTGIEANRRIGDALTGVLADSYVLMVKTQSCHWNVVGPLFQPIHDMTEAQYRALFEAIDDIAERIRALGLIAPLAFSDMLAHASLDEERAERTAAGMVERLAKDHEALVRRLREVAKMAAAADDGATEDLMNARMADHEKTAWMLRAVIAD